MKQIQLKTIEDLKHLSNQLNITVDATKDVSILAEPVNVSKLEMGQAQVVINRTDKPNISRPLPRSLLTLPAESFRGNRFLMVQGDSVRHRIQWKKAKMAGLKGEMLRLEFEFKNADIYAFLAAE